MAQQANHGDRNIARLLLKELTAQLKVEDKTYEAYAVKLVGGEKPPSWTLSCAEVLCEPLFWPIVFAGQHIGAADIESSWGIAGPLLLSFTAAFRAHYAPTNPWIEDKIQRVVEYVALLARAYLGFADIDAAPETFERTNRVLFKQSTEVIDHLDWNRVRSLYGRKEGTRFRLQIQTRSESFARRNRGALAA